MGKKYEYDETIQDIISKRLSEYLDKNNISYDKCADAINAYCEKNGIDFRTSNPAITNYVGKGKTPRTPPASFISAFAQTFDVSVDYLFGEAKTSSRNNGIEAAAAAIGTSDPKTIGALQKIYAVWRDINPHFDFADNPPYRYTVIAGSGDDITNILDEIIQSEFFSEMFTGYTLHINNKYFRYGYSIKYEQAHNEFYATHGYPENTSKEYKAKKATRLEELEYDTKLEEDTVWARIARNALAAIENSDLSIRAYLDKKLLREIDEMKQAPTLSQKIMGDNKHPANARMDNDLHKRPARPHKKDKTK